MRYFLSPSLRPLPDFPSPLHSDLLSGLASLSLPSFTLRNSETVSLIHRNARAGPGPQERRVESLSESESANGDGIL